MTVLFFMTILFDEVGPKVLCIILCIIIVLCIILSQTANSKKRERLLVVDLYVCPVCFGSKNSEDVLFCSIMIPLENSVPT